MGRETGNLAEEPKLPAGVRIRSSDAVQGRRQWGRFPGQRDSTAPRRLRRRGL